MTLGISLALTLSRPGGGGVASLAAGIAAALEEIIAEAAGGNKTLFSTIDHATPNYVRDANCWAAALASQFTCVPVAVFHSGAWSHLRAALITTRHIYVCEHAPGVTAGDTVRFVTAAGALVTRTVLGVALDASNDAGVAVLDSALPGTITPCKLIPDDWFDYLDGDAAAWFSYVLTPKVPLLWVDQENKALIQEIDNIVESVDPAYDPYVPERVQYHTVPVSGPWAPYAETALSGDSGSPFFLLVDGELCLISNYEGRIVATMVEDTIGALILAADAAGSVSTGLTPTAKSFSGIVAPGTLVPFTPPNTDFTIDESSWQTDRTYWQEWQPLRTSTCHPPTNYPS